MALEPKPSAPDPESRSPALAGTAEQPEDDQQARISKKELRRLLDEARPLEGWERYRALNDALGEAYDLIDIANREARFALILVGGLNAVLFVAAAHSGLVPAVPQSLRPWMVILPVVYVLVAVYFVLQAIETLRPRKFRPDLPSRPDAETEAYPLGVRYYEDVVRRDAEGLWKTWQEVRLGQLNAELVIQLHSLCLKNQAKHVALRRLYGGLRIMTLLIAPYLLLLAFFAFAR